MFLLVESFAYFLKEKFKDMLEFANDKKITESMNEMEIYEYLECMLKIIRIIRCIRRYQSFVLLDAEDLQFNKDLT